MITTLVFVHVHPRYCQGLWSSWTQKQSINKKCPLIEKSLKQKKQLKAHRGKHWRQTKRSRGQAFRRRDKTRSTGDEAQDITTFRQDMTTTIRQGQRGSTETYIHTQGRQGQLDTGGTHEDWCRQSQTEERKHTRNRNYKIKQETEHRERANQRKETTHIQP